MKNELLLIPNKADPERDALAKAWQDAGGQVQRIGKFWIKPNIGHNQVTLYGYDTFCLVLAQLLGLQLAMVNDEWLAALPPIYLKRAVNLIPIQQIEMIAYPKFIKPVTPKLFQAAIFHSAQDLNNSISGIDEQEVLICSDIITITQEVRSFILNGVVQDLAFYEGSGDLAAARQFIEDFLLNNTLDLPRSFVLDVGFNATDGWFVIEFNSSWGAGLNGCNAEQVLPCIQAAVTN